VEADMRDDSGGDAPGAEEAPDLEYDLAHETAAGGATDPATGAAEQPNVYVATETTDYDDGDYGYDMAHDVPGR
jgi:hypothetical protein